MRDAGEITVSKAGQRGFDSVGKLLLKQVHNDCSVMVAA
jgi:hypothetical protein